ncbi:hypothetical protein Tco_0020348 [Tanacetum coccineum]
MTCLLFDLVALIRMIRLIFSFDLLSMIGFILIFVGIPFDLISLFVILLIPIDYATRFVTIIRTFEVCCFVILCLIPLPELFVTSHGGIMAMSLMHRWHNTICGGVIGPRHFLFGAYGCIIESVWMHPRYHLQGCNRSIVAFIPSMSVGSLSTTVVLRMSTTINEFHIDSVGRSIKKGLRKPGYIGEKGSVWMHPRAFLKLCIVEDPIWDKISHKLEEILRNTHVDECVYCQVQHMTKENVHALRKEMREIHVSINNDLKVLTAVIEDIPRVFLQDPNGERIEKKQST